MGHRHSHLRAYERQAELFPRTVRSARRSFFSVRNLTSRHNDTESVAITADFDDWPKHALAKRQYASASTTRLPSHTFSDGHTFSDTKKNIIEEETRLSLEMEPKSLRTKNRADSGTAEAILPLELLEADRQQKQHQAMKRLFQTNFQAPIHAVLNSESGESGMVLEVMCGQGTWTLDMANDFPTTMFFGVHTSRAYPTTDFPANCFFQEGTPLETRGLPFRDNTFDYVIQRFTLTGLSPDQRECNLKELMRVTKPGGYIEVVEADVPDISSPFPSDKVSKRQSPRPPIPSFVVRGPQLNLLLLSTGMTSVRKTTGSGPAHWASTSVFTEFKASIESLKAELMTGVADAAPETYDELERKCLEDFKRYQTIAQYDVAWGQKPMVQEAWGY